MDQWLLFIAEQDLWGLPVFILFTTLISGILSGIIGFEREIRGQSAGLRTHVLLAVGSAVMMSISIFAIQATGVEFDASRIGAGVVSGIGFLCAGCIIRTHSSIKGLTTSATLWICGGLGLACGAGFVVEALIATLVSLFFLLGLVHLEKALDRKAPTVLIRCDGDLAILSLIHQEADTLKLTIKDIHSRNFEQNGYPGMEVIVVFAFKSTHFSVEEFLEHFQHLEKVRYCRLGKFAEDFRE